VRYSSLLAAVAVTAALVHNGAQLHRSLERETGVFTVAGIPLTDPLTSRDQGVPIWSRESSVQVILQRRGYQMPAEGAAAGTCGISPGIADAADGPLVLLGPTRFGVLAESPDRGVLMIADEEADDLWRRCRPAVLLREREGR